MTKKDLLEAIKDMPMDAEIWMEIYNYGTRCYGQVDEVLFDKETNTIDLC